MIQYLKREESCSNYTPFSFEVTHQQFCIDRFCSCQQLKLLCPNGSNCTDALMYTYVHTFREESRLESSNLHMQTGVKNFLIRLLRVSLWPRSPKMTATGFSQRGTQNASLYYFLATICLCQEDRQIRIYKNILHSIIIQWITYLSRWTFLI